MTRQLMVDITEKGTLDFNPYVSLVTSALIGHTYSVNWEGSWHMALVVVPHTKFLQHHS